MEPGSSCPEGSSMHHAMGINARQTRSSTRERNHFTLLFTLSAALGLCVAFLAPLVGAEDTLTFKVPGEVTLCTPVNFTWTGGIPPYRLDVEPTVNNVPNTTANQRRTAIQNTWVLWTPEFPAGSRLEINVVGSGFSPSAGGFSDVLSSSDSSCLAAASTTASAAPSTSASSSSANGPVTSVDQPSATPSPAILVSSRGGLSKGAIAGIAVAATLIGIGLIALAAWYLYRRKHRLQQPEKGYDRSIVSPAFSDDAPSGTSTVPYSGLSSTLLSVDPNKLYAFTTPSTSVTGASSPDDRDPLRPTPYLVPPESTTDRSLSTSDVRKGPAPGNSNSKKHARELSDPTSTSNESAANLSASDDRVRATVTPTRSASPSLLACSADGDEAGSRSGSGDGDGDVLRFDADGAARLSLSLGSAIGGGGSLHLGFSDIGASDEGEGETTLPPPYAHYFGGGPRTEEA